VQIFETKLTFGVAGSLIGYSGGNLLQSFPGSPASAYTYFAVGGTSAKSVDDLQTGSLTPQATVPEPDSLALFGLGLVSIVGISWMKKFRLRSYGRLPEHTAVNVEIPPTSVL